MIGMLVSPSTCIPLHLYPLDTSGYNTLDTILEAVWASSLLSLKYLGNQSND